MTAPDSKPSRSTLINAVAAGDAHCMAAIREEIGLLQCQNIATDTLVLSIDTWFVLVSLCVAHQELFKSGPSGETHVDA